MWGQDWTGAARLPGRCGPSGARSLPVPSRLDPKGCEEVVTRGGPRLRSRDGEPWQEDGVTRGSAARPGSQAASGARTCYPGPEAAGWGGDVGTPDESFALPHSHSEGASHWVAHDAEENLRPGPQLCAADHRPHRQPRGPALPGVCRQGVWGCGSFCPFNTVSRGLRSTFPREIPRHV